MKLSFKALVASTALLASVCGASAASYLQASSTEDQIAKDTKPIPVVMNSTDASKGIKMEKGVVTVNESGTYFIIAAVQVGARGATGNVRMWLRINGKDADNSNTEQAVEDPKFTGVMVSQGLNELKKGDKIQAVYSASAPGIGLVYSKPAGEPAVPSVIFSAWKID